MNPARWAGLGKLLGLWPGDGDGLVYNDEPGGTTSLKCAVYRRPFGTFAGTSHESTRLKPVAICHGPFGTKIQSLNL